MKYDYIKMDNGKDIVETSTIKEIVSQYYKGDNIPQKYE
jgi:hypothetical protein